MIKSLLHVNVEYENGLYAVNDREVAVLEAIPNGIEITAPFFNEENNLEEIEDAILMEDENDLIITWNSGTLSLVLALAGDLANEYGKNVYIPMDLLAEDEVISAGDGNVIFVKELSLIETALEKESCEKKITVPEEYIESEKNVNGSRYFVTMKNGYDAFVSGVYPQQLSNTFAKHVFLNNTDTDINAYMDLNSAVFSEEEVCANKNAHIHGHLITRDKVTFDGTSCALEREVIPYGEFASKREQGQLTRDHEYILKLETSEDYLAFENDLKAFEETGTTDTYERRLMDECRWSNECSLKRMLRFVENDGEIRPCITSPEAIGRIGDDPDDVITAASRKYDVVMIDRKCMSCSEHDRCSGCAMLPGNLSANEFCDFMHRHQLIKEYIHRQHVAAILARFSQLFCNYEKIRFSIPGKRFFYLDDVKEKQEIFICEKEGNYYYLNLQTNSLVRIEEKFVFLMEAWSTGADIESQILNLSLVFGFDSGRAQEAVVMGNRKLKNGGMIV